MRYFDGKTVHGKFLREYAYQRFMLVANLNMRKEN